MAQGGGAGFGREVDREEPSREDVEEVVEAVGVCDAVDGCVERREEGQDIRDESCSATDTRGHVTRAHNFHHENQWQDR